MVSIDSIVINREKVSEVAALIKEMSDAKPFNFASSEKYYPKVGDEKAIEFFFGHGIQNFHFCICNRNGYVKPYEDIINGEIAKGSDFAWQASKRMFDKDPDFFSPKRQSKLTHKKLKEWFANDNGECNIPMLDERGRLANLYGSALLQSKLTPDEIIKKADGCLLNYPVGLLNSLDRIPGYCEDPLAKKSMLLAMELSSRPEQFLKVKDTENWGPIIDYHIQRVMLRSGMVNPGDFESLIKERRWVPEEAEMTIRDCSYNANSQLIDESGKNMATVDFYLFSARRRCPEMEEPKCSQCSMNPACEKHIEYFQPIFRTTFY